MNGRVLRSPKESAGSQDAAAQKAADQKAMEEFLKGTPTKAVNLPPANKMKTEFSKEMASAATEYTKTLKAKLEEDEGKLTNPKSRDKIMAMAKATGFWSEEKNEETGKMEGRITDIDGFISRIEYLIKQTTVEIAKKMPDVRGAAEGGSRFTNVNAPVLEKGSKEEYVAAGEVMAVMEHFGLFCNSRENSKFGFGDSGGRICNVGEAVLSDSSGNETTIGAARICLRWNGPVAASTLNI